MTYIELLTEFVEGTVTVDQFQESFLTKFKQEESFAFDEEFKILDKFFGDVDSYCDEDSELFDPDFDLTEKQLRSSAQETLTLLKAL
jgi:hypothetical protein